MSTRTATETRRRIDRAQNTQRDLTAWVEELSALRAELLLTRPNPRDSGIQAAKARDALRQVEDGATPGEEVAVTDPATAAALRNSALGLTGARRELERLTDEIRGLEAQLPTPAEIAAAEERAEALGRQATEIAGDRLAAWTVVVNGLVDLLPALSRFAEATAAQLAAMQTRRDLAEQLAIDPPTLELPELTRAEVGACRDLLFAASQVAGGQAKALPPTTDALLRAVLDSVRERLERESDAQEVAA